MKPFAGDVIRRWLARHDLTPRELAEVMRRPVQMVNGIVMGRKSITPETALELESALGIKAEKWLKLQAEYEIECLRMARNGR